MAPEMSTSTAQEKYESILARQRYEHHCFMECVLLRIDPHRGTQTQSNVQNDADMTFTHMLTHAL